jgi:pyridoxamine 5'-phosphate oxidase
MAERRPLAQFETWLQQAIDSKLPEPNAMTLATVGANGRPSTRIVLIKGVDERGLTWFTNYDSRKGQELAGSPVAALQFHWVELERVVRIEGTVERVPEAESDAYYASRPIDFGRASGAVRCKVCPVTATATPLGRLPPGARLLGVLARSQKPLA